MGQYRTGLSAAINAQSSKQLNASGSNSMSSQNGGSSKRVLALDSSPEARRVTKQIDGDSKMDIDSDKVAVAEMEEDIYAANRKLLAAKKKQQDPSTSRHFPSSATLPHPQQSILMNDSELRSQKRLRTGREDRFATDSLPPSSPHSGVTSPVGSASSFDATVTSPAPQLDDSQLLSGSHIRDSLSQLRVESGPNSTDSSRRSSAAPTLQKTAPTNDAPDPMATTVNKDQHGKKREVITIDSSVSPVQAPRKLIRGRPLPPPPPPESPLATEAPLYPQDKKFNEFYFQKMKGAKITQENARTAWESSGGDSEKATFACVKMFPSIVKVGQPSSRQLGHSPFPSPGQSSSSTPVVAYTYKPKVTIRQTNSGYVPVSDDSLTSRPKSKKNTTIKSYRTKDVVIGTERVQSSDVSKKKKRIDISSGSDADYNSDGSGDEFTTLTNAQLERQEITVLAFFNDCTKESMVELACKFSTIRFLSNLVRAVPNDGTCVMRSIK